MTFTPCPGCDGHECVTECMYPRADKPMIRYERGETAILIRFGAKWVALCPCFHWLEI